MNEPIKNVQIDSMGYLQVLLCACNCDTCSCKIKNSEIANFLRGQQVSLVYEDTDGIIKKWNPDRKEG